MVSRLPSGLSAWRQAATGVFCALSLRECQQPRQTQGGGRSLAWLARGWATTLEKETTSAGDRRDPGVAWTRIDASHGVPSERGGKEVFGGLAPRRCGISKLRMPFSTLNIGSSIDPSHLLGEGCGRDAPAARVQRLSTHSTASGPKLYKRRLRRSRKLAGSEQRRSNDSKASRPGGDQDESNPPRDYKLLAVQFVVFVVITTAMSNVIGNSVVLNAVQLCGAKGDFFRKSGAWRLGHIAMVYPEWVEDHGGLAALCDLVRTESSSLARGGEVGSVPVLQHALDALLVLLSNSEILGRMKGASVRGEVGHFEGLARDVALLTQWAGDGQETRDLAPRDQELVALGRTARKVRDLLESVA